MVRYVYYMVNQASLSCNWLAWSDKYSGKSELWIDVEVSSRLIKSMEDTVLLRGLIYR